jgi:cAMP-specific phosphodiesterase 4
VSFLCDRAATDVPKTQPGFINFIVVPLFKTLTLIMPTCQSMVDGATQNAQNWAKYEETQNEK